MENFEPKIYPCKLGNHIRIRIAEKNDAASLRECILSYINGTSIPFTRDEFTQTESEVRDWIQEYRKGNNLILVAEYAGDIIGNIDVTVSKRSMLKHTGYIGMGVHGHYQNCGIGNMLMKTMMDFYREKQEIELLWLQVFGDNQTGIHLYRKHGFYESGRQEKFIKMHDGTYVDNVIMTKYLSDTEIT